MEPHPTHFMPEVFILDTGNPVKDLIGGGDNDSFTDQSLIIAAQCNGMNVSFCAGSSL